MTGTFGQKETYIMGNPTYFALPETYKDYYQMEDNLFHSIPRSELTNNFAMFA